jgi:DNA topoisomerase-2
LDDKFIRSYTKNCTDLEVNIEVRIAREVLSEMTDEDLITKFQLTSRLNASNMHLFDKDGKIKKYNNPYEIIDEYFDVRLEYYDKRKAFILNKLNDKKQWFDNVIRFIKMVIKGDIVINNKPLQTIKDSLEKNNFDKIDDSYQYLFGIAIYKFSKDELDKLNDDYKNLIEEIKTLEAKDNRKLWSDDLIELKKEIKKIRK